MAFHRHMVSLKFAWEGLVYGLRTQPNFRIHLLFSFIAVSAAFFFKVSQFEFIIVLCLIGLGLAIEFLNTAVESAVDLMTDKHHLMAKRAKDCAAAAMLVFSLFAFVVSVVIFLPKIILWWST